MNASEIIVKLDELSEYKSDEELVAWLEEVCDEYDGHRSDDERGRAALYNELGSICRRNGWLEKGESAFLAAKEILERAGIGDGNYATTLNNLAGLYRLARDFDKAFELFERTRKLYESQSELPVDMLASCSNNLGLLYLDKGQYSEALAEFEKAESMITAIPDDIYVQAVTSGNCAYAWYGLGNIPKAAEKMLRAARYAEKLEGRGGEMYLHYARLYRQLGGEERL